MTVYVRPSPSASKFDAERLGGRLPGKRSYLTLAELEERRGATWKEIEEVEEYAGACGLDIVEASAAKRAVSLSGTIAQLEGAFRVKLMNYRSPTAAYRGRTGHVHIPKSLEGVVQAVVGLDDRPQARPHMQSFKAKGRETYHMPGELTSLYGFPQDVDGKGECVAIIELGGGFRLKDLDGFFRQSGSLPPTVVAASAGSNNAPSGPSGPDGEVMLDIEVAGSVAPAAKYVVYFAPNTDRSFMGAVQEAIHDVHHGPSVISISWGDAENKWTVQTMRAFNEIFVDAAALGISVLASSGDAGSTDKARDGLQHVNYPASSPFVLACGGTQISTRGNVITEETAWNQGGSATGGGVSDVFDLPAWQKGVGVPPSANPGHRSGRGVPDVSGCAAHYGVLVDGVWQDVSGTSAVAPLYAGLIALVNQSLGRRVGYINPLLYKRLASTDAIRDITQGSNGAYRAAAGWDPCTGVGRLEGRRFQHALHAGGKRSIPGTTA